MSFKLTSFILLFQVSSLLCITSNDVCVLPDKNSNQMTQTCKETFCHSERSFECGEEFCSKDKDSCILFLNSLKQNSENQKNRNFLSLFKKSGGETWESNGVCLNGEHCYSRKMIPLRSRTTIKVLKRIECPCLGYYSFQCGKDFCALDESACEMFNANSRQTEIETINIKKCGNDKLIF